MPAKNAAGHKKILPTVRISTAATFSSRCATFEVPGMGSIIGLRLRTQARAIWLEAALWAFYHSSSFEEGALLAVNLGEDADTTGAVFGQLAGAYYGKAGIPSRWFDKLYDADEIQDLATRLYRAREVSS